MSLAVAESGMSEAAEAPDELPDGISSRGLALSAALHIVIVGGLIGGLPRLFEPPPIQEMPIAVQLVTIAPETRATHPNPNPPLPDAKPEVPDIETPVAKPQPKPEPPKLAPAPPSAPTVSSLSEQHEPEAKPPPVVPKPPEPKPEPPRPVEKLDVPKPKEKPEPPQIAKSEARPEEKKPEEKKYDPSQFAALLKNLAPEQSARSPDAPPQNPRTAAARPSSQPKAPLGSQITASEIDLVRQQIARCWNVPAGARDAKDLVIEIRVAVDPDGTVRQATIVDQRREADPFYRAAAESARRAFFNPLCRPLHLPAEKYAIWKDLVVDFSPKDLL
jgi:outer membrane biosynthesis protein TonB